MIWRREYSHLTTATADAVWKRWTTPEDWAVDDPDLRAAEFTSPRASARWAGSSTTAPPRRSSFLRNCSPGSA